jgi:hypothetical protein
MLKNQASASAVPETKSSHVERERFHCFCRPWSNS